MLPCSMMVILCMHEDTIRVHVTKNGIVLSIMLHHLNSPGSLPGQPQLPLERDIAAKERQRLAVVDTPDGLREQRADIYNGELVGRQHVLVLRHAIGRDQLQRQSSLVTGATLRLSNPLYAF